MTSPAQFSTGGLRASEGLQSAGTILQETFRDFRISKRQVRKAEGIELVRYRRDTAQQRLGFASRPFVLCGLPLRRPPQSSLIYERRNGFFTLQITGHPDFGLPFGQDRLVPIFLATLAVRQQSQTIRFKSAAQMLDTFGMASRIWSATPMPAVPAPKMTTRRLRSGVPQMRTAEIAAASVIAPVP